MAYTGILLRGDTYDNIHSDPAVGREAVIAGEFLSLGTFTGVVHYLNIEQLARIGKIGADGTYAPGFKTSALPITFNGGTFDTTEDNDYIVVEGHNWRYEPLANIEAADATNLTISGVNLSVPGLALLSSKPTIDALTADDITVSWSTGAKCFVYNNTTSTMLGEIALSGGTLTFSSAQTTGDEILVWTVDDDTNTSMKRKGVIA
jgi:hypothetical protein